MLIAIIAFSELLKSAYMLSLLEEYRSQIPSTEDETGTEKMEEIVSELRNACVMVLVE